MHTLILLEEISYPKENVIKSSFICHFIHCIKIPSRKENSKSKILIGVLF
jgi:hypothetical protein